MRKNPYTGKVVNKLKNVSKIISTSRNKKARQAKGRRYLERYFLYLVLLIIFGLHFSLMRHFVLTGMKPDKDLMDTYLPYTFSSNDKQQVLPTSSADELGDDLIAIQLNQDLYERSSSEFDGISSDADDDWALPESADEIGELLDQVDDVEDNNENVLYNANVEQDEKNNNENKGGSVREELHQRSLEKVENARKILMDAAKSQELPQKPNPVIYRSGTCDENDAFLSIPLDNWHPPIETPDEIKREWERTYKETLNRITTSKLGGDNIRQFVREQTDQLKKVRHTLFCKKDTIRGRLHEYDF